MFTIFPAYLQFATRFAFDPRGRLEIRFKHGFTLSTTIALEKWRRLQPMLTENLPRACKFLEQECLDALALQALQAPPPFSASSWMHVVKEGLEHLMPWLPAPTHGWVRGLVENRLPCVIFCVKARKSKHGDHLGKQFGELSKITISISGNPYQQFITVIHELAHNEVALRWPRKHIDPHGQEWQLAYQRLLVEAWSKGLFPENLKSAVYSYAMNPKASSSRDIALQTALREYDTADKRKMVGELATGIWFSLDGKLILQKGERLRTYFICKTTDGRQYRVHPTARVKLLYESP